MTSILWINEPSILFNKEYIFDLFPNQNMYYEEKINAITRLIILITILGYIFTFKLNILFIGLVTLTLIFIFFKMKKPKLNSNMLSEGFSMNNIKDSKKEIITNPVTLETVLKTEFQEGTKKNPFSNVLLTDIMDDPNRKSAPPAFNVDVSEDITKNTKKQVQFLNPEIKNTNKQLFSSLTDNFYLDQSNRAFFSTANTKVENDQSAFAQFLYGNMISGKESNEDGAIARVLDNYRYTMY
jgi:hypothetical protein